MTRKYTPFADENVKALLNQLVDQSTTADAYRQVMYKLGYAIGTLILQRKADKNSELLIACTVEDADFLAKGIVDVTENTNAFRDVRLACFWNERIDSSNGVLRVTPIIKRYREPFLSSSSYIFVVVKSIVATGCVVRTNLQNLIQDMKPKSIVVASPVMMEGADILLKSEFLPEINKKFEFLTYAIDDRFAADGNVEPGIGGNVYDRLGFSSQENKNQMLPELVRTRRLQFKQDEMIAKAHTASKAPSFTPPAETSGF